MKALAERFPDLHADDGGTGISAQYHVPIAEVPARQLELGDRQWPAS